MRLIDADAPYERLRESGMVFALHTVETAPTITPLPNDLLTLSELQKMGGKPVFIEFIKINRPGQWEIIRHVTDRQVDFTDGTSLYIPDSSPAAPCYGRTWLAYRSEPEGTQ